MRLRNILLTLMLFLCVSINTYAQTNQSDQHRMASLYELPPFERAVFCIKYYEGLHRRKDFPYVGYGHKLKSGEHYSSNMSAAQAEDLLRKDLTKLCKFFRSYDKDSLLLAALAYNVGVYKVIGNSRFPKSRLIKMIESGARNFQSEYLGFCFWRGRRIPSIERRRYVELLLLYCK